MSKSNQVKNGPQLSLLPTRAEPLRSFYIPHERVTYTGMLSDPGVNNGIPFKPPARTKQEFKSECDINSIIKQYKLTGQIQHINVQASQGAYLDLPDNTDFKTALAMVADAESAFATLPSRVRERFGNNPAEFLTFMDNPANLEELYQLGIKPRPPEPQAPPNQNPPPSSTPKDPETAK